MPIVTILESDTSFDVVEVVAIDMTFDDALTLTPGEISLDGDEFFFEINPDNKISELDNCLIAQSNEARNISNDVILSAGDADLTIESFQIGDIVFL